MKKLFLSLLSAVVLPVAVHAQQPDRRGIFLEGTAGLSTVTSPYEVDFHFNLSPAAGYRFGKYVSAGFRATFETGSIPYRVYTPFVRLYYLNKPTWELFVEGQTSLGLRDVDGGQSGYTETGVALGGCYVATPRLRLVGRYLFVGVSDNGEWTGRPEGENRFLFDARSGRLHLGFQWQF